MSKVLVFGHQNPDTDTIGSAIALDYLLNTLDIESEAVALGKPNPETQYALDYFSLVSPRIIETAANEVKEVVLVDHNEAQQSVSDLSKVKVKAVVDHHRIANFHTNDPLYYRAEPVGCTATILLKIFKEYEVAVPKHIAGIMVSAIISDTLLLKSPTCTPADVQAAGELAKLAEIDLDVYGLDMLKAGTDISDKSGLEILNDDAKSFPMGHSTIRIGQVNVVDPSDVLRRKKELLEIMRAENLENDYDLFILLITDIVENNSIAIVEGPAYRQFEMAFNTPIQMNMVDLDGVVSRKKQVVPPLSDVFEKQL